MFAKKCVWYLARIVVPLALFFYILSGVQIQQIPFSSLLAWELLFATITIAASYLLRAQCLYSLLGQPPGRTGYFLVTAVYSWLAIMLPAGLGHIGLPVLLHKHYGVAVSKGGTGLLLLTLGRLVFLTIAACSCLALLPDWHEGLQIKPKHILFILALFLVFFLLFHFKRRLGSHAYFQRFKSLYSSISSHVMQLRFNHLSALVFYTIAAEIANFFTFWFLFDLAGIDLSVLIVVLTYSLLNLSFLLPIYGVAGLGTFEAVVVWILLHQGISFADAATIALLVHFAQVASRTGLMLPCYAVLVFRKRPNPLTIISSGQHHENTAQASSICHCRASVRNENFSGNTEEASSNRWSKI